MDGGSGIFRVGLILVRAVGGRGLFQFGFFKFVQLAAALFFCCKLAARGTSFSF